MNVLEKEIEELIFNALVENPQILLDRGIEFIKDSVYERQPILGNYGRPDIVGYTVMPKIRGFRTLHVTIYEFKKEAIDVNALMQGARYNTGIRNFIKGLKLSGNINVVVHTILIGKTMETNGDFVFLLNMMQSYHNEVSAYTYNLDLVNGLTFTSHIGYYKLNPAFQYRKMLTEEKKEILSLYRSDNEAETYIHH